MEPLASCFADQAWFGQVKVAQNVRLARDTFRLRFDCPAIARRIVPGQFIMLRLAQGDDPLLGRPLALYDTVLDASGEPIGLDIVYLVVGKLTRRLAEASPGCPLEVWGPLGNGFAPQAAEHVAMIAGGIGQTPFLALARECLGLRPYGSPLRHAPRSGRVTLCYGVRTAALLAGVEDFQQLGVEVRISTDDGSAGHPGLVTDLLRQLASEPAPPDRVVCCGPEKMMEAAAELCCQFALPCEVSLESPMACGVGICFSCVTRVRDEPGGWDYRRTCIEGPVFDAQRIVW